MTSLAEAFGLAVWVAGAKAYPGIPLLTTRHVEVAEMNGCNCRDGALTSRHLMSFSNKTHMQLSSTTLRNQAI